MQSPMALIIWRDQAITKDPFMWRETATQIFNEFDLSAECEVVGTADDFVLRGKLYSGQSVEIGLSPTGFFLRTGKPK